MNRRTQNETKRKRRFRFSVRTLLIIFALVAVSAGLLGQTLSGYFREVRRANALKDSGADVLMAMVPPKGTVDRLLYRFGARKIFNRVINLNFEADDQVTDEIAAEIARLPNLLRLKIEHAVISDKQLTTIAESPSLQLLTLYREGRIIEKQKRLARSRKREETKQRIAFLERELEQPQAVSGYGVAELKALKEQLTRQRHSLASKEVRTTPQTQRDFGDDGIQAFLSHPTLKRISLTGCNVSDRTLRKVLLSLNTTEDIPKIIQARRQNELMLSGVTVKGMLASEQPIYDKLDEAVGLVLQPRDSLVDLLV